MPHRIGGTIALQRVHNARFPVVSPAEQRPQAITPGLIPRDLIPVLQNPYRVDQDAHHVIIGEQDVPRGLNIPDRDARAFEAFLASEAKSNPNEVAFTLAVRDRLKGMNLDPAQAVLMQRRSRAYYKQFGVRTDQEARERSFRGLRKATKMRPTLVLEKAAPRGGNYHRRVTDEDGSHRYFDKNQYQRFPGAHLDGGAVMADRVRKDVMTRIGKDGLVPESAMQGLFDRWGQDKVERAIEDLTSEGKLKKAAPPLPKKPPALLAEEAAAKRKILVDAGLAKAEGSRGGKVIGHTSSGKPVYAPSFGTGTTKLGGNSPLIGHAAVHVKGHEGFSAKDHEEAAAMHKKASRQATDRDVSRAHQAVAGAHGVAGFNAGIKPGGGSMSKGGAVVMLDYLRKSGGEGSKGGHVIGHTSSGKPIYASGGGQSGIGPAKDDWKSAHAGWSPQDHAEAREVHRRAQDAVEATSRNSAKAEHHYGEASRHNTATGAPHGDGYIHVSKEQHAKLAEASGKLAEEASGKASSKADHQHAAMLHRIAAGHHADAHGIGGAGAPGAVKHSAKAEEHTVTSKKMKKSDGEDDSGNPYDFMIKALPVANVSEAADADDKDPEAEADALEAKQDQELDDAAEKALPYEMLSDPTGSVMSKAGGPFIGPHGGKWANAEHTIPWNEKKHSGKPPPKGKAHDPEGADELKLYAENDGDLHRQQHEPIRNNLTRKLASGKYDHAQASKLYAHMMDNASKKYAKENGGGSGHQFDPATRMHAAKQFADQFIEEAKAGEHDHRLNGADKKRTGGSLKSAYDKLSGSSGSHPKEPGVPAEDDHNAWGRKEKRDAAAAARDKNVQAIRADEIAEERKKKTEKSMRSDEMNPMLDYLRKGQIPGAGTETFDGQSGNQTREPERSGKGQQEGIPGTENEGEGSAKHSLAEDREVALSQGKDVNGGLSIPGKEGGNVEPAASGKTITPERSGKGQQEGIPGTQSEGGSDRLSDDDPSSVGKFKSKVGPVEQEGMPVGKASGVDIGEETSGLKKSAPQPFFRSVEQKQEWLKSQAYRGSVMRPHFDVTTLQKGLPPPQQEQTNDDGQEVSQPVGQQPPKKKAPPGPPQKKQQGDGDGDEDDEQYYGKNGKAPTTQVVGPIAKAMLCKACKHHTPAALSSCQNCGSDMKKSVSIEQGGGVVRALGGPVSKIPNYRV